MLKLFLTKISREHDPSLLTCFEGLKKAATLFYNSRFPLIYLESMLWQEKRRNAYKERLIHFAKERLLLQERNAYFSFQKLEENECTVNCTVVHGAEVLWLEGECHVTKSISRS